VESEIGAKLFGECSCWTPPEFFCLDPKNLDLARNLAKNPKTGKAEEQTIRYESARKWHIEGSARCTLFVLLREQNSIILLHATTMYYEQVARQSINADPRRCEKLA